MTEASFEVTIGPEQVRAFAEVSGDWNPLHTDPAYAAGTQFGRPILHGAFSAGLVSRMAGMYIPGTDCLLHGMHLRFLEPVVPPVRLVVRGKLVAQRSDVAKVNVTVSDVENGRRYAEASYEFSSHLAGARPAPVVSPGPTGEPAILVTGATGGIGRALLQRLGSRAVGIARRPGDGLFVVPDLECVADVVGDRPLQAIVHCAWPAPDNVRLTRLEHPAGAVEHNVAQPLRQVIRLAQLLQGCGTPDAVMVLVGSTAAEAGRHAYRAPLYTLAKSLVPLVCRILAVELGGSGRRCVAVVFDVVGTGMNQAMSPGARIAHEERAPTGRVPTAEEVADQLAWVVDNRSFLLSGATITLSGGALP